MEVSYEKLVRDGFVFNIQEFVQQRFTSPYHLHDEFELILIARSHGKLYVGSNVVNFADGDLFLFAPRLPHCFYNSPGYEHGNIPARAMVIQFGKDFLGEGFLEKSETSQLKKMFGKALFGLRFVKPGQRLAERILALDCKKNLERISELLSILHELSHKRNVVLLSTEDAAKLGSTKDSLLIRNVYRYVAENFQQQISFDEAATIAHMQRSAFCRLFKRKTKKTFSEFVNETRIMHARKLLAENDKTITEIAYECGYESVSYFHRQFRLLNGMTPSAFRGQFESMDPAGK